MKQLIKTLQNFTPKEHVAFLPAFALSFILGLIFALNWFQTERVVYIHTTEYVTVTHYEQLPPEKYDCVNDVNCRMLAEAIYFEARGEDLYGQVAVGWVIVNRAKSKYFPDTIPEVIKQSCQFSYRCDGSMKKGFAESEAYEQSLKVAAGIMLGIFDDPTNGADHYLNIDAVKVAPRWAKVYPKVASIGNHDFHSRD